MCRAAMWRAALSTALCVGTFTCAVALIDACLRVNTQSGRLVRTRHVSRRTTEFPIQLRNFRYNLRFRVRVFICIYAMCARSDEISDRE